MIDVAPTTGGVHRTYSWLVIADAPEVLKFRKLGFPEWISFEAPVNETGSMMRDTFRRATLAPLR